MLFRSESFARTRVQYPVEKKGLARAKLAGTCHHSKRVGDCLQPFQRLRVHFIRTILEFNERYDAIAHDPTTIVRDLVVLVAEN